MTTNWTPTPYDVFNTITAEAYYVRSYGHAFRWLQSQDKPAELIQRVVSTHLLVKEIQTSTSPPLEIVREAGRIRIKKALHLADDLYKVMHNHALPAPTKYQLSPHAVQLDTVVRSLGLNVIHLSGNPLALVSNDGLLEGEIINSLALRIKEGVESSQFHKFTSARMERFNKTMSTSLRYLKRCVEQHPHLYVTRWEFSSGTPDQPAMAASQQILAFFTALADDLKEVLAGHWFKREYRTETGFTHHVVLFCDSTVVCGSSALENAVLHSWGNATHGKGLAHSLQLRPENSRTWGIGMVHGQSVEPLFHSVRLMLETDRYFELSSAEHFPHVGMGKLPSATKKLNTLQVASSNGAFTRWGSASSTHQYTE